MPGFYIRNDIVDVIAREAAIYDSCYGTVHAKKLAIKTVNSAIVRAGAYDACHGQSSGRVRLKIPSPAQSI